MSNEVYANMMEVSCKAANGKAICAMPDVCFTPPQTPATPPGVPIPYPNTGMASDCTDGSSTVSISGQEAMLKNKSYFKRSSGDEAGCAPKKGVVTSQNMGKVYFNAWSMDVQFEGENVVRHLDLTTHNHASFPGNSPTWPYLDAMAFSGKGACAGVARKVKQACVGTKTKPKNFVALTQKGDVKRKESMDAMCADEDCKKAMECVVSPYSPNNCCPDTPGGTKPTPHHIVPKSQFKEMGEKGDPIDLDSEATYKASKGPCICVSGTSHSEGDHGDIHSETNTATRVKVDVESGTQIPNDKRWPVSDAESVGAQAVHDVTDCPKGCIEQQVRAGHEAMGIKKDDQIRPTTAGGEAEPDMSDVED
jgi:hypothetical protein